MLQRAWPKRNDTPPSTARLQASTAGFSEQDQGAERRLPTTFLRLQQPQLDDTRASSMIAAADTHRTRPKSVAFYALWGVSNLALSSRRATRRRSHSTRLAGGVDARCHPSPRTQPRDPAIWVWRSLCRSLTLLQTYIAHPHAFTSSFICLFFSPFERRERMRWPVFAIVLDVICDSRG